jgi:Na+/melibiose symporter-like transporter
MHAKNHAVQSDSVPSENESEKKIHVYHSLFTNCSFLWLWLAQLFSQIAFNAANYGVIVLVTQVTHGSAFMVGLAIVSFTLPAVPFSILAGVTIDTLEKRQVLWLCNLSRAIITALLVVALLWKPDSVLLLYILNFFISLVTQFFMPAEEATIPVLVKREELEAALGLFSITLTLAQAIGFLILGQVIAALFPSFLLSLGALTLYVRSIDLTFLLIAVIYGLCALMILGIPKGKTMGRKREHSLTVRIGQVMKHDVKESWQLILHHRHLLVALLRVAMVSVLLLLIGQLAGPFVTRALHLPVSDISFLFAPAGVTLVLGGIVVPRVAKRLGNHRLIELGTLGTAMGLLLLEFANLFVAPAGFFTPREMYVSMVSALLGLAITMINVPAQTLMQNYTPEEERGRVFSFRNMFYNALSIPILLSAGLLADETSLQSALVLVAAALLCFQWWAWWYSRNDSNSCRR